MSDTGTENKVQLGELLVAQGAITPDQVREALEEQRRTGHNRLLGEILVDRGSCAPAEIASALAQSYQVPFAEVSPRLCDPDIFEILPREFLEQHVLVPLFKVHDTLTVAVNEPANLFVVDQIEQITGYKVQVVCSTQSDITATLQAYSFKEKVFAVDDLIEQEELDPLELIRSEDQDVHHLSEAAGQSSIVQLVNYLLADAVKNNASDIHIEPDENFLRVRYRVDGTLVEKSRPPHKMHSAIVSRIRIMADLDLGQRSTPQDGKFRVMVGTKPTEFRVSIMPGNCGEKVALRIVDPQSLLLNLEALGFTIDHLVQFRELLHAPQGLVLVSGPAGSGKNTTLHAALGELNSEQINICTVEDTIGCNLVGVNQFEVNTLMGGQIAATLRNVLRQDPDVVMVSEIRDEETAALAVHAALTGDLVLSTVHTPDAPSAVGRLVDLGVQSYFVSDALIGILAQRLVRKICSNCKETYHLSAGLRKTLSQMGQRLESPIRGAGCRQCRSTGYAGRIAIHELFLPDERIREKISERAGSGELRKLALARDMQSLVLDGIEKVRAGLVTIEDVLRVTPTPDVA
ncbi:MAG: Flp pilus assembly complex ATPase component TadA [Planctomycetes bacterium]|nr:Flp pilus assembly complex ATPase component TadA [Planctomycetota bacterium]